METRITAKKLDVGVGNGRELFFTHYSIMAFDPRDKRDRYANYFQNNRDIALISYDYSVENPNISKPIVVMIENHRTGLIWKTSMSNPEVQPALDAIGFHKDCVALASRKDDLFCGGKVREDSFPDLSHHANIAVGHFGDLVLDRSTQN